MPASHESVKNWIKMLWRIDDCITNQERKNVLNNFQSNAIFIFTEPIDLRIIIGSSNNPEKKK